MEQLTVSEIAERVAPKGDKAAVQRITRQLRHWTVSRVLEPSGGLHTGPGRHRRYSGDAIYMAAVLVELSNMGFPVGVLFAVASLIRFGAIEPPTMGLGRKRLEKSHMSDLWNRAIKGEGEILMFVRPGRETGFGLVDASEGIDFAGSPNVSYVIMNLTRLFAPLRP